MYEKDDRFNTPDDVSKIWRYMDYDKFRFLIENQSLYFCSMDTLKKEEPNEGSYYACKLLNEVDPSIAQHVLNQVNLCGPPIAVNCWHLSEDESIAMWERYSDAKGIAIQTRVDKLKAAFHRFPDSVRIGEISYTDGPIQHPNDYSLDKFWLCMTKRKCFEHEKELRVLIWYATEIDREKDGSVIVPIEVNSLVEKVYLSPKSEDSLRDRIRNLMLDYGINITPVKSQL